MVLDDTEETGRTRGGGGTDTGGRGAQLRLTGSDISVL